MRVWWVIVGAVAAAVLGFAVYHHLTGARLRAEMVPTGDFQFHLVIHNDGGRGTYAHCRAAAFDSKGIKVFTHWIGFGPAGPYVDAHSATTLDQDLPAEWVTAPIVRFNAVCVPIDYGSNVPV